MKTAEQLILQRQERLAITENHKKTMWRLVGATATVLAFRFGIVQEAVHVIRDAGATKTSQNEPIRSKRLASVVDSESLPVTADNLSTQLSAEKLAMIDALPRLQDSQRNFLKEIVPAAIRIRESGAKINPAIMAAQAIVETGWGQSAPYYNYFGVKAGKGWSGAAYYAPTPEKVDGKYKMTMGKFRAYQTPEQAFEDYVYVIATESHFQDAEDNYKNPRAYLESLENENFKWASADNDYVRAVWAVTQENHLIQLTS